MRALLLLAVLVLTVPACGRLPFSDGGPFRGGLRGAPAEIEGVRFRSRVAGLEGDARAFSVATRGAGRAVPLALEAARVEGLRFCLRRFGGTEIAWAQGPDQPPERVALREDGALVLTGRCLAR